MQIVYGLKREEADLFIYLLCLGIELELINLKIREKKKQNKKCNLSEKINILAK
jgi:hypothetical protein